MTEVALLRADGIVIGGQRVTAAAGAQYLGVVGLAGDDPTCRGMTGLANQCGANMGERLPRGAGAVVATGAVAGDANMVEAGGEPRLR